MDNLNSVRLQLPQAKTIPGSYKETLKLKDILLQI